MSAKSGALALAAGGVVGTPRFGETLTATPGAWDAGTTVSYRWLVGGKVRGTKPSLKLTGMMAGKRVVLQVVVTKPGYETLTVASKTTGKVKAIKKPKKGGRKPGPGFV